MLGFARLLMAIAAITFVIASAVHFGLVIPVQPAPIRDRFLGAAGPEGLIAIVLAAGVAVLTWSRRGRGPAIALGTTLFALALTAYGLSVTLGSARTGDIAYHVFVFVLLLLTAVLLTAAAIAKV